MWIASAAIVSMLSAQEQQQQPPKPPGTKRVRAVAAAENDTIVIPDEYPLVMRMEEKISTKTHFAGQRFKATLLDPIVIDGNEIANAKAEVEGFIVEVDQGGRVEGVAHMILEVRKVKLSSGQWLEVKVTPERFYAKPSKLRDACVVAGVTGAGAAVGGVAGGGGGAATGAVAGAAVGTAAVLLTKGKPVEFAVEEKVVFRTKGKISYEVPK